MKGPTFGSEECSRLRTLILNDGSLLVAHEGAPEAGLYLLGDAIFSVHPREIHARGPWMTLVEALADEGEDVLRSAEAGDHAIYRWHGSIVTVEDGIVVNVCLDGEWGCTVPDPVFSQITPGFMASYGAVTRWKEFYFFSNDDGMEGPDLYAPGNSVVDVWTRVFGAPLLLSGSEVTTRELTPAEVRDQFRVAGADPDDPTSFLVFLNERPTRLEGEVHQP